MFNLRCLLLLAAATAVLLTCSCSKGPPRWGYIDRSGKLVIAQTYDSVGNFSEGLAPVLVKQRWGYIDRQGTLVIPAIFHQALEFSDGLAAVALSEDQWGYIDHAGAIVIPAKFMRAGPLSEGVAAVCVGNCRKDGRYGYIDRTGALVIQPKYTVAGPFSEGLAAVAEEGRVCGYIDHREVYKLEPHYWCSPFLSGRADQLRGYIDQTGAMIIRAPRYGEAMPFSDGWGAFINGSLNTTPNRPTWAVKYVDESGKVVLSRDFCGEGFYEGLAAACDGDFDYGFIDKSGKWVIDAQWSRVGRFKEGLAAVCTGCDDD